MARSSHAMNKAIILPHVHVDGKVIEDEVERIIEDWKRIRPDEFRVWPRVCAERRASQARKGWTKESHMKLQVVYPTYVLLMVQRFIGHNDLEESEHRAILRVLPCCRMDTRVGTMSSVLCDGDKYK